MMRSSQFRSERGSLPLVLLAAIIMAGVITALFVVISTGTDTAQRDRDVAQAFQVADAGLQEAYVDLLAVDIDALDPGHPGHLVPPCKEPSPGSTVGEGECTRELPDGSVVTWEYEQQDESRLWVVVARGNFNRSDQVVRAEVGQNELVVASLTSLTDIRLDGLGSAPGQCESGAIERWSMAAAGKVTINGQGGKCVSEVTLHEGASEPDLGSAASEVNVIESGEELVIPNRAADAFGSGICATEGANALPSSGVLTKGESYCVGTLTRSNLVVEDPNDSNEPATIYVKECVKPGNFTTWNTAGAAGDLLIHIKSMCEGVSYQQGPQSMIRATVIAPTGLCRLQAVGAANNYFMGSLSCNDIRVNGVLDYDASVFGILDGEFGMSLFSQEARGFES